jgi:hypothetical protein
MRAVIARVEARTPKHSGRQAEDAASCASHVEREASQDAETVPAVGRQIAAVAVLGHGRVPRAEQAAFAPLASLSGRPPLIARFVLP